ncbi:hypothetical protein AcetOrient_orf00516 [Acetobacter orientalis]|uniref:Abortive infection protein-like C-terminal domain-containing protein n=1 Tax=Acetobacter orientalis TaxID=146474 RepID=A0A2Z5ZDG3_9PROT|nr:hypothetical protein AcetOrient_orf00516 [Acetobacter orientalis]
MRLVNDVLIMHQGYVLDFSDASFNDFISSKFGIDATAPAYTVEGTSKAKRLRVLLRTLVPGAQAEVLRAFWEYRQQRRGMIQSIKLEPQVATDFLEMLSQLEASSLPFECDPLEAFSDDPTLVTLVEAIKRDIQANAPQAALDRLHTYCAKKFTDLLQREGETVDEKEALHARAGRYINNLRQRGEIGIYSAKIAKAAVNVMEQFNQVRNNQSLAHDNTILSVAEGRYVYETVTSLLRFIKTLDDGKFGR